MSVYGQDKEKELHERLSTYIHGGADCNNSGNLETNTPSPPDSLFDAPNSPGPSSIASAFTTAASSPVLSHPLSTRPSQGLPEIEVQVEADADNGGWTSTESTVSRAGSVGPDAGFAAGTGGHGGARGVGYGAGGRSAASGAPPAGFGMGRGGPATAEPNVVVVYRCWACNAMVSIGRKEMIIMCSGCGGRIMMKLRPERTITYSTM
ncbi:hypothetical protein HOY80DRAFT_1019834 [Tuber brumale]|nr:hypothetical protein HOY80DRAFT_1019834 [Tuber brumale]